LGSISDQSGLKEGKAGTSALGNSSPRPRKKKGKRSIPQSRRKSGLAVSGRYSREEFRLYRQLEKCGFFQDRQGKGGNLWPGGET